MSRTRQKLVRIQVTGPFAELDFTVPEKKAPAQLRKIKRTQMSFIRPKVNEWREKNARYKWTAYGRKKILPRIGDYCAKDVQQMLGIEPTTIKITTI